MDLRLATSCALAIVAACSPGEKPSSRTTGLAAAPTSAQEDKARSAAGREESALVREQPTAAELLQRSTETLCDAFDRTAVAKQMGWRELKSINSDAYTADRSACHCMFMAKDDPDGAGFGVTFTTTFQFMETHLDAPYLPREPVAGHEAVVAKHADGNFVSIQIHARGITIETNANDAGPPNEVEVRLANATSKLLATLAIDPAADLHE